MADVQPTAHQPHRDSDVAAWIKAARDLYPGQGHGEWEALDGLLDDYQLHADTGTPLGEHACAGPYCVEGGYHPPPEADSTEIAARDAVEVVAAAVEESIARTTRRPRRAWPRR